MKVIIYYSICDFHYKKPLPISESQYAAIKASGQPLEYPNIFVHFFQSFRSFTYLGLIFLLSLVVYFFIWGHDFIGVISFLLGLCFFYYVFFGGLTTFLNWTVYRKKLIIDVDFQNEIIDESKSYREYVDKYSPLADDFRY